MKSVLPMLLAAGLGLSALPAAHASLIVTYAENAGQQTSSLKDTHLFDFNTLATGVNRNVLWSGVGIFDQLYIQNANQYGGATDAKNPGGTRFSVQGVGSGVSQTTLTLKQDSGYFGMWWSAGDASNLLDFYNDGKLVAEFTTSNLLSKLGSSYFGNPRNRSLDSSEPFAFINFFGDANTKWDQVVFRNTSNSGFESDNYTSRISTYNPVLDGSKLPGVAVARVSGTTVTKVSATATGAALWGSTSAIPGAPVPPVPLLVAFGLLVLGKARRDASQASAPAQNA